MEIVWCNKFFSLRDKITQSETIVPHWFISPQEIVEFSQRFWDMPQVIQKLSRLPRFPDRTLDVLDFDDTISSRDKSFFRVPELIDRRWALGNEFIEREIGFLWFVHQVYQTKDTVAELVNVLMSKNPLTPSLLLSAGLEGLQNLKFKRTQLSSSQNIVVDSQSMKPEELLKYIIDTLWYIPGKIIIYEDRPECFLKTAELLVKILGIEIVVNHVHLSSDRFNTIDSIQQTIFQSEKRAVN